MVLNKEIFDKGITINIDNDACCLMYDLVDKSYYTMEAIEGDQYIISNLPLRQNPKCDNYNLNFRYFDDDELDKSGYNPCALCDLQLGVHIFKNEKIDLLSWQKFFKNFLQMLSKKYNVYGIVCFNNVANILLQYK